LVVKKRRSLLQSNLVVSSIQFLNGDREDLNRHTGRQVSGARRSASERRGAREELIDEAVVRKVGPQPRGSAVRGWGHADGTQEGVTAAPFRFVKGVLHQPDERPTHQAEARDAILLAAAKARVWIDDLTSSRIRSFAEIARSEGKVERHIRLLAPLAFVPPRVLAAIVDGAFRPDVTVTTLARTVPFSWSLRTAGGAAERGNVDRRTFYGLSICESPNGHGDVR
jgi:hypothetical protein